MTLDEQIALLQGVKSRKVLQCRRRAEFVWNDMILTENGAIRFDPEYEYRLKPEPSTIPFTQETVTKGALWMHESINRWVPALGYQPDGILVDGLWTRWEHLASSFQYSLDGGKTWCPAVQEVGQ